MIFDLSYACLSHWKNKLQITGVKVAQLHLSLQLPNTGPASTSISLLLSRTLQKYQETRMKLYNSGLTIRSPIGLEVDMMLPGSQVEMPPQEDEEAFTTSITLSPSNLAAISICVPAIIAFISLAITVVRIATLPIDCAIITRAGRLNI